MTNPTGTTRPPETRQLTELERARRPAWSGPGPASCGRGRCTLCASRRPGYHLWRFIGAFSRDLMTAAEVATVIAGLDVFTPGTVIRDGAQ